MGDERIREGVVVMPARRMADEARLLGEHDQVLVLVADVEGDVVVGNDDAGSRATRGDLYVDLVSGEHEALFRGGAGRSGEYAPIR